MRVRLKKNVAETSSNLVQRESSAAPTPGATVQADPLISIAEKNATRVPAVLTVDAVIAKAMPPLGTSGLSSSLELNVPPRFRYWTAKTEDDARATRDALVESGMFLESSLQNVGGEIRRITTKTFIEEYPANESTELAKFYDDAQAGVLALGSSDPVHVLDRVVDSAVVDDIIAKAALAKAGGFLPWLSVYDATNETLDAVQKAQLNGFSIATRPGKIFVTSASVPQNVPHVSNAESTRVDSPVVETPSTDARSEELIKAAFSRTTKLLKADTEVLAAEAEERFVLGVVLEPDVVDSQSDTYSAEEVRQAAHKYLEDFGNLGLQHKQMITGKIKIAESYIAPCEMKLGDTTIKAGTWLMAIRVLDDTVWKSIKDGDLTGFSMGGSAIRTPESA